MIKKLDAFHTVYSKRDSMDLSLVPVFGDTKSSYIDLNTFFFSLLSLKLSYHHDLILPLLISTMKL